MELLQIVPVFNFIILILHHPMDYPVSCTVEVITQMTQAISSLNLVGRDPTHLITELTLK